MATTAAFQSLSVPAPDDTMEISSPANRPLDEDIDFDIDDDLGGVNVGDDERMFEDSETRPGTGTDEVMQEDAFPQDQTLVQEDVMQDDGVQTQYVLQEEDEDLIDYSDDEDEVIGATIHPSVPEEGASIPAPVIEQADEEFNHVPQATAAESKAATMLDEATPTTEGVGSVPAITENVTDSAADAEDWLAANEEDAHHPDSVAGTFAPEGEPYDGEEDAYVYPGGDADEGTEEDALGTPTDTGLHPMTVSWNGAHMPLFKSKRQPGGLLKNDNLANLSLADLIRNCRQGLQMVLNESLSRNDELVLSFDSLALTLVEDARAAFELSLNDVLEVYLQLHRNEGVEEIAPLEIGLRARTKFASSFALLRDHAASGEGISTYPFSYQIPEEDLFDEQYHEADPFGGYGDGYTEDAAETLFEDASGVQHTGDEAYADDDFPFNKLNQLVRDDEGYDRQVDDAAHKEGEGSQAGHSAQDRKSSLKAASKANDQTHVQNSHATPTNVAVDSNNTTADRPVATPSDKPTVTARSGSAASSTTAKDDTEDLNILKPDEQDDFGDFLTDMQDELQQEKNGRNVQQILDGGQAALKDASIPDDEHTVETLLHPHLDPEDVLNDLREEDYPDPGQYEEEGFYEEGADEEYNDEQAHGVFEQADVCDQQQDDHDPNYEPGEEEGQFGTAQDFLNGDYYEHGPEHGNPDEDGLDDTVETVVHHQVHGDDLDYPEDDIDFDDEQQTQPSSLHAKRSFDDLDEVDFLENDEPELKKAKAR